MGSEIKTMENTELELIITRLDNEIERMFNHSVALVTKVEKMYGSYPKEESKKESKDFGSNGLLEIIYNKISRISIINDTNEITVNSFNKLV